MTAGPRKRPVVILLVVLSLGAALLAHLAIVQRFPRAVGAVISLVPAALLLGWMLRRSARRALVWGAALLAGAAVWIGWEPLQRHFPDLFFVEHVGSNLALAFVFGRTLAAGREPLCTRFARLMHETLPPEVVRYTRGITVAWTIFFVVLATVSVALYAGGFLAAWSMLATLLSPVLLALMFVGEYAVRLRALPHWERVGVLSGIRAFSRHFATARLEAPR